MKRICTILLCLLTAMTMLAQKDSTKVKTKKERQVTLVGSVYDSFTKARIKAHITLMTARDSAVVDTTTCWIWDTSSYYQLKVPARNEDYIIKGTCEGYEDGYLNYNLRHISRNNHFELPRLLMKKKQDDGIYGEGSLDEVVVTGTKVKIAYRGDTIVYNASAFNLPEGSMLDGLIRQMPGAELKDNGDIYINGKKVDYLTLNGKDFFKGNNKVMLDNLPYFTVKDIKVYDKSTKQSKMIGHDVEKKDYVMDVSLKREYNRGYLANVEAGLGMEKRYMARLFSLYYDDHSRVSLFGNVNNVNENRKPGGEGEWSPANMPTGLRATKQIGMNLTTEDSDKNYEEELSTMVEWSDNDFWSRTSSETFASEGNIFGGSSSTSRQKDFRLTAYNSFQLNKPFDLMARMDMSYTNGHRHSASQDSTYRDHIINRVQNTGLNRYRSLNLHGQLFWVKKFEWGDYLVFGVNGSYYRQKPGENFSRQDTYYAQTDEKDLRDYYADTHSHSYNYSVNGNYVFQMPNQWYIGGRATYTQSRESHYNSNYRLDWLGDMTPHDIGWLPSSREVLEQAFDPFNSDDHQELKRTMGGELSVTHSTDKSYISFQLPLNHTREKMRFVDDYIDTLVHRNYTVFSPTFMYFTWGQKSRSIRYNVDVSQPDFASLMPTDDTTNPLAYRINNPDLKSRINHNLHADASWNVDSLKRHISVWANATLVQRAWGTRTIYDTKTGGYIFMNDNVNGNWNAGLGASYQQPIDKKKRLTITQRADIVYNHSVDFDILYDGLTTESQPTSTVNNWTFGEHLRLEYQKDKLTVTVSGNLDYRLSYSDRRNFQRINAFDFDYGTTLRYTIPWLDLNLATDLRMFSRRGYYSAMMNDDHLVWNAELTRAFFNGKLTAKLQAFDLLHQLSSTQYNVNAQGRTETWQNCIPRYLMFTLAYKFTQKPKSK